MAERILTKVISTSNRCERRFIWSFEGNWYPWLAEELRSRGIEVALQQIPDPCKKSPSLGTLIGADHINSIVIATARESIWLPFIRDSLKCNEETILIGHSSGAEAAMRYVVTGRNLCCHCGKTSSFAEMYPVHAIIIVSGCVTDLGDANERASGEPS